MVIKKSEDIDYLKREMKRIVRRIYRPSLWSRFITSTENMLNALLIFVIAMMGIVLIVTLIKNPISLAICCATVLTILLIIMWGRK